MFAWITTVLATSPLKPEFWLEKAGASAAYVVTAIIFAESGLFFGFFLPGDSLLFLSGFLTSSGAADYVMPGQPGHALAPVVEGMPHLLVLLPMFFIAAVAGDQVGYLFGGLVIVEVIFNYNGLGRVMYQAAQQKDFPLLQSAVLIVGCVYLIATLIADILYSVLNPRVRLGGAE